jgi:hypothetical protein
VGIKTPSELERDFRLASPRSGTSKHWHSLVVAQTIREILREWSCLTTQSPFQKMGPIEGPWPRCIKSVKSGLTFRTASEETRIAVGASICLPINFDLIMLSLSGSIQRSLVHASRA